MVKLTPLLGLLACRPGPEPLNLTASDPPVPADGAFYSKVAYDVDAATTFDLFVPPGEGPFPLLFQVHGGGFVEGAADELYARDTGPAYIDAFVSAGVAVANVDYRLLDDIDSVGVYKPMGDVRRCLQFIRWHAEELLIDPTRIAGDGTSAGAGTVVWLAVHPDAADPEADDRVLRQSTVLTAANAQETQATYDVVRWETDVFAEFGITLSLAANLGLESRLNSFYGISRIEDLYVEPAVTYRADVDLLGLMSSDDPPLRIENVIEGEGYPSSVGELFHHPFHAREMRDAALAAGVSVEAYIPNIEVDDTNGESGTDFLLRQLQ